MRRLLLSTCGLSIVATGFFATFNDSSRFVMLGERSLDRIVGLSDTSSVDTSACATLALNGNEVLYNNCAGKPDGTPCIRCSNEVMAKFWNTSGGPGVQDGRRDAICENRLKSMGSCIKGSCANYNPDGMCGNSGNFKPPVSVPQ